MSHMSSRNPVLALVAMIAVSIGLYMAPENVTNPIRSSVRDSVLPGHRGVELSVESWNSVVGRMSGTSPNQSADELHSDESPAGKLELRRLQIENARLREQIQNARKIGVSPYTSTPSQPLMLDELISANVFGKESATLWQSGVLINRGQDDQLRVSDLVLTKEDLSMIDVGSDVRLETGFPVFTGRCVFGRVSQVGRWTSTVEHVSDPKFRGHAQIVRKSSGGFHFGAQGVLEGIGDGKCRLKLIAATAPVEVGDDVYTNSEKGMFPFPMYYGRITRAELKPGESHWQIEVEPAVTSHLPRFVQILRKRLNAKRVTAGAVAKQ